MKIREFTVTNFRGFENENTFLISERFTVIAGVNGRGKTSLLDGLALLVSRLFRSLGLSAGNQRTIAATDVFDGSNDASLSMRANCAGIHVISRLRSDPIGRTFAPRHCRSRSSTKSSIITATRTELTTRRPSQFTTRRTALDCAFRERYLLNCQPDSSLLIVVRYQTDWSTTGISWLAIAFGSRRRRVRKSMHSRERSAFFSEISPMYRSKRSRCD